MKDFDWWNAASDAQRMKEFFGQQTWLADAERLLRSVAAVGYEENGTLFSDIDAFLAARAGDGATEVPK